MKKTLLLASILLVTGSQVLANCPVDNTQENKCQQPKCEKKAPEAKCPAKVNLAERLNLTEEQIKKARDIRMKSKEKIVPLFEELKSKECQRKVVLKSKIVQKDQIKLVNQLDKDIAKLKKQIRTEQIKNQKQFEAILTDSQKQELQKLKMEGRKNFAKKYRCHKKKIHEQKTIKKPCKNN